MKNMLIFLVMLLPLAGCDAVIAVPAAADEDAPQTLPAGQAFILQPGDSVKLTVYGEETLTGKYQISSDGFINVPLLGSVDASGQSKDVLQEKIKMLLKQEGYLTSPKVTVDMDNPRPVYVMGEVRNPGSYAWQPAFTAFNALASAGGYTPRAAHNKILIDRVTGNGKKRLNATESTPLLPGDAITVRERIL